MCSEGCEVWDAHSNLRLRIHNFRQNRVPAFFLSFGNCGAMGVCRVLAAHYGLPPSSSSGGVTSAPLPASAVVSASPAPLSCEGR